LQKKCEKQENEGNKDEDDIKRLEDLKASYKKEWDILSHFDFQ